ATKLFKRQPRPVLLVEVQDVRTRPWGYAAKEILEFLAGMGYTWFRFSANGSIEMLNLGLAEVDGNFVACPEERFAEIRGNLEVRHTQWVEPEPKNKGAQKFCKNRTPAER